MKKKNQPYFVDHKRGEIEEIRTDLQDYKNKNKRDTIRKVMAYMSLGIDVSRLYSDMIMAASTTDAVQKKMVYHYLCTYAQEKSDLAILCINTLQKDCQDQYPMFRGLALRSLCGLRVPNITEYAIPALRRALSDPSAYVRKTAVLAAAKIHAFQPQAVDDAAGDLVEVLQGLLRDPDTQVVTNVILALEEILKQKSGSDVAEAAAPVTADDYFTVGCSATATAKPAGLVLTRQLMLYLLNRLHEFPEWGQCTILGLAARYTPEDEEELFDILNLLEDRFKHANSAVVMATIKVFLHLTSSLPEIHEDVLARLVAPLLTLASVSAIEIGYAVLTHILALAQHNPAVFAASHKLFFIRQLDTRCVGIVKAQLLGTVATVDNAPAILQELRAAAYSRDEAVASAAVAAIGKVAVCAPAAAEDAVSILLELAADSASSSSPSSALPIDAIVACRDLLRVQPARASDVLPAVVELLKDHDAHDILQSAPTRGTTAFGDHSLDPTEGVCALAWMLGEFGAPVAEAPYALERLVKAWAEITSDASASVTSPSAAAAGVVSGAAGVRPSVALALLTACVTLFLARPPEMQATLGLALSTALPPSGDDASVPVDVCVMERAALYLRLLEEGPEKARAVIAGGPTSVEAFWEDSLAQQATGGGMSFQLREFDSLSVVYSVPESGFAPLSSTLTEAEAEVEEVEEEEEHEPEEHAAEPAPAAEQLDLISGMETSSPSPAEAAEEGGLKLSTSEALPLDADTFQELWASLPEILIEFGMDAQHASDGEWVERALSSRNIFTMAAGETDGGRKYFLYAGDVDDVDTEDGNVAVYLLELEISTAGNVTGSLKTNKDEDHSNAMYNIVGMALNDM